MAECRKGSAVERKLTEVRGHYSVTVGLATHLLDCQICGFALGA